MAEGKVVLIIGPTASRKTTLTNWLIEHGENVVDADKLTASWHKGRKPYPITEEELKAPARYGLSWDWDEKRLKEIIDRKRDKTVYVIGTAGNTLALAESGLFDVLICIRATREELERSMIDRPARHPEKKYHYGRTEEQRDEVLAGLPAYYERVERMGFKFIDIKLSEADKFKEIQKITAGREKLKR